MNSPHLLKIKKNRNPVTVLSIVLNNRDAEQNLLKARSSLHILEQQAAAAERKINLMVTLDNNVSGGIVRVTKEELSNILVLGWPQRAGVIDFIIGYKLDSIIHQHFKTIFICHFSRLLMTHSRLILAVPPLAELENGFQLWMNKTATLAKELNLHLHCFCNTKTQQAIRQFMLNEHQTVKLLFESFTDWEHILELLINLRPDDILLLVSSRKRNVSHLNVLENLPYKMEKNFETFSRIIIFPEQNQADYVNERYEDLDAVPILRGVETLNRIGKGVGGIFKKTE